MNKVLRYVLGLSIFFAPLADKTFHTEIDEMSIDGHQVAYSSNIQDSNYTHKWISEGLRDSSKIFMEYSNIHGYTTSECRSNNNLNIYIVDMNVLNDRDRFSDYYGAETNRVLWALFDQIPDQTRASAIILTDHGSFNSVLFAHEIAHYWSYRFCWDFFIPDLDNEKMAQDFEKFYLERK